MTANASLIRGRFSATVWLLGGFGVLTLLFPFWLMGLLMGLVFSPVLALWALGALRRPVPLWRYTVSGVAVGMLGMWVGMVAVGIRNRYGLFGELSFGPNAALYFAIGTWLVGVPATWLVARRRGGHAAWHLALGFLVPMLPMALFDIGYGLPGGLGGFLEFLVPSALMLLLALAAAHAEQPGSAREMRRLLLSTGTVLSLVLVLTGVLARPWLLPRTAASFAPHLIPLFLLLYGAALAALFAPVWAQWRDRADPV